MNLKQMRNYLLELDKLHKDLEEIEIWLSSNGWSIIDGKKYHTLGEDGKPDFAAIKEVNGIKEDKECRIKFLESIYIS